EEIKNIWNQTSSESVRKLDKNIVSKSANEQSQTCLRELEEDNQKLLEICEKYEVRNFIENCDIRLSNKATDLQTSLDSPDQANNDVAKQTNIKSQKKTFRLFNIDSTPLYDVIPGSFAQKKICPNTGLIKNKNNSNIKTDIIPNKENNFDEDISALRISEYKNVIQLNKSPVNKLAEEKMDCLGTDCDVVELSKKELHESKNVSELKENIQATARDSQAKNSVEQHENQAQTEDHISDMYE
ncbi:uncharacterized protein LOC118187425, partial [Stegodyphus dumicola]|uniref:uncharacterized protein LOC118187425 n=1 Tax=Stegodyphus dumicola TaxID=202533 RepID=UPI0015AFB8D6